MQNYRLQNNSSSCIFLLRRLSDFVNKYFLNFITNVNDVPLAARFPTTAFVSAGAPGVIVKHLARRL